MLKTNIGVLALGNLLRTDEGAGIHLLESIKEQFPSDVEYLDGATSGLELLDFIQRSKRLIVLDAVDSGKPPGEIIEWCEDEVPRYACNKLSLHQLNFAEVLYWGQFTGDMPEKTVVIGIQPESLDWGLELTETTRRSLPGAASIVLKYINTWKNQEYQI